MGGHVHVDTIVLPGEAHLTVRQDATSKEKYEAGVANLRSRNAGLARELIWQALMGGYRDSEAVFYWLIAMLSDRTVGQFSREEIGQLRHSRHWVTEDGIDAWADGARLIYRLLDSVLPAPQGQTAPTPDLSLLQGQVDDLRVEQRDMIRPHLELFLTGPLQDRSWQVQLERARSRQCSDDRPGRAWMFFQPVPVKVAIPPPRPEWVTRADLLAMRASAALLLVAVGYFGWELLSQVTLLGVVGYVAGLAGGAVAAVNGLEWRFRAERQRLQDDQFRVPSPAVARPSAPLGNALSDRVDKLFDRYFRRYAPDNAERGAWKAATAGIWRFHRDEIIEMCQDSDASADAVAWLIRYRLRRMKQCWQEGTLRDYRRMPPARPSTVAAYRTGLAVLVLGGACAIVSLRVHPLADVVGTVLTVPAVVWAWRCFSRVRLERRRYAADSEERTQRQAEIDEEFARWSKKLERRPKDAEMADWLECDRTVLLGMALDHFHLARHRLFTHAFLEEPGVAARGMRIPGGLPRYTRYRLLVFLLVKDGVRQVRANLDSLTGTLTIRERTNYRYDAIVSVRVVRNAGGGQEFELRLAAGDAIAVRVRDTDSDESQRPSGAEPTEDAKRAGEEREDSPLDVASIANTLHVLEGVAAEGRNWFHGRAWAEG
jgi:hypothetical protein